MPVNGFASQRRSTLTSTPQGTLQSNNLYHQPPVPGQSQAAGLQGTDGRGYTRTVGPNELSTTQLNQITGSDSPYMKQARAQGLAMAARRGLGNSSIAAGNAQGEAIRQASPFAMQQADAYGRAQTENLGYMNQNLMQERDITNTALQNRLEMDNENELARLNKASQQALAANDYRMFQENLAYQGEQRGLDRAHDFGMSDMGFRQDLGRMDRQNIYDLGTLGYQQQFQSREADRDVYRNMAQMDNQFANQRYNDTYQAINNSQINRSDLAYNFMLQQLADDPSTSLSDMDGFYQWANMLSGQQIDDMLNAHFGGG